MTLANFFYWGIKKSIDLVTLANSLIWGFKKIYIYIYISIWNSGAIEKVSPSKVCKHSYLYSPTSCPLTLPPPPSTSGFTHFCLFSPAFIHFNPFSPVYTLFSPL